MPNNTMMRLPTHRPERGASEFATVSIGESDGESFGESDGESARGRAAPPITVSMVWLQTTGFSAGDSLFRRECLRTVLAPAVSLPTR